MRIGGIIRTTNKVNPEVKTFVRDFKNKCVKQFREEQRNQFGRVTHLINHEWSNALLLCCALQEHYGFAALAGVFSLAELGLDKLFHNLAMRKSQIIVKELKAMGKDKKFITEAVDYYLKTSGGIIHSNFVRKFRKKDIAKVVSGKECPQIPGIISFIQTECAFGQMHNKPAYMKAQKNKKIFINKMRNIFCKIFPTAKK